MKFTQPTGALATWIETFEPLTEAPAEAQLAVAVGTISAAIGWKAPLKWGASSEPCTISTILEAGSAMGRKTTTANGARALVHEATGDIPDEHRGLYAHVVGHTSDRGLIELVSPTDETNAKRYEDTPPPGHVIVWDEIGGLLGDPGQNRKGGDWQGRIRTTLMQLANGRHGGIKTGGTKLPASRCAVAVIGTMTRVELEQRVDTGLLRDGFLGRFMLIPHNGRARILSRPPAWTASQLEAKTELVAWLRELSERRTDFGEAFSLFTDSAAQERDAWYEKTTRRLDREAEQNPCEQTRAVVEAFGRLQTTQVKLAVVAAVSDMPTRSLGTATPIVTVEHVEWASEIIAASLEEISILSEGGDSPDADKYRARVIEFLVSQDDATAGRRELLRDCRYRNLDSERRWRIVKEMHEEGIVTIDREATAGRPRHVVILTGDYRVNGHSARDLSAKSYDHGRKGGHKVPATSDPQEPQVSDQDTTIASGRKPPKAPQNVVERSPQNRISPTYDPYDSNDLYVERENETTHTDRDTPLVKRVISPSTSETWLTIDNPDQEPDPF